MEGVVGGTEPRLWSCFIDSIDRSIRRSIRERGEKDRERAIAIRVRSG
jgi:hypothetical protein